jgi:membrane associated rhomboid family serine protease
MKSSSNLLSYFAKNLVTIVGVILIWRGVWYLLDEVDKWLFGGIRIITAIGGIIVGLLLLFLPDKNLKEIGRP